MTITQQYLLDTYRAQRLGTPAPPAPGAHDWQVVRELHDYGQFRAVIAERPAHKRIRQALGRWLRPRARPTR
ncbi:hypothetical protein ADK57_41755 [Streptomyces sp. MMG1533]|uniref:hypothetical protein n=1 Tax=Streptomyces sp. MMG1533 TaxID=1415546 RepID=UPI0006AF2219|nr:hypothetical protein [Streptomyces sp. MMG1533]KOU56590.1 hypothetical protein ADK57_41755 [Streptomyces sp. MMG1533]